MLQIAERLQQIEFDVVAVENAKKKDMLDTLQSQMGNLPTDAITIVYFTGHGGHSNEINYVYPSDFATLYEQNHKVEDANSNKTIYIADWFYTNLSAIFMP